MPLYGLDSADHFEFPDGQLLLRGVRDEVTAASSSYVAGAVAAKLIVVLDPDADPPEPDSREVNVTGIVPYEDGADPAVLDFTDGEHWQEVDGVQQPVGGTGIAVVYEGQSLPTPKLDALVLQVTPATVKLYIGQEPAIN